MSRATILFLSVIAIEAVLCTTAVIQRLRSPAPVLPNVEWADPLIAGELQQLVKRTRSGASTDWQNLGEALLGQGLYSNAELCFRQALAADPGNRSARFSVAFCLARTGRLPDSTREFQTLIAEATGAIATNPFVQRCQYEIGLNQLREEQADQAEQAFRDNPNYPPARLQLAKLLVRAGRLQEAMPLIEDGLRQNPRETELLFLLYRARLALGDEPGAQQAASRLARSTNQIPVHLGMEYVQPFHLKLGLERQLQEYNHLLASRNMDRLAEKMNGILSEVQGQRSRYVRIALTSLLEIELQRRQPDQLRKLAQQLRNFGEQNAEILQFEGVAEILSGNSATALELWERAARMSPNIQLYEQIAGLYSQQENRQQRDWYLARCHLLKGMSSYRNDEPLAAAQFLLKSVALNPNDAQVWYYLAESQRLLDEPARAQEAYERCLAINPNHGRALAHRQRLSVTP